MEELRAAREKIITLDEKAKREEKNSMNFLEKMVHLEEKLREYKSGKVNSIMSMQQRELSYASLGMLN